MDLLDCLKLGGCAARPFETACGAMFDVSRAKFIVTGNGSKFFTVWADTWKTTNDYTPLSSADEMQRVRGFSDWQPKLIARVEWRITYELRRIPKQQAMEMLLRIAGQTNLRK